MEFGFSPYLYGPQMQLHLLHDTVALPCLPFVMLSLDF